MNLASLDWAKEITGKKINKKRRFGITLKGYKDKIYLRSNSSDSLTFLEIFLTDEYLLNVPITPKFIVDLGANVGLASVYFANKYPNAKIVAVEPEDSNFSLLEKNLQEYDVQSIKSGIWYRETFLKVVDSGYGEWGFRVEECENPNEGIKAITVQNILRDSDFDEIDILKIDIEGAERELFSENFEGWLPNVKVLIIEIHDYLGFYGASQSLFKAILKYDFSVYIKGESLVFIRKDIFNS